MTEGQHEWVDQSPDLTPVDCLDGPDGCEGEVAYRMSLSGTGLNIVRCDHHWAQRLERQAGIEQRYPYHQPPDFDPTYAGERWDDDY